MTKIQRERDRANRKNLARQLAIVADPSLPIWRRKRASRHAAALAEKIGLISRPEFCQACGRRRRLERHHPHHLDPLRIVWLCRRDHEIADRMGSMQATA